MLINSSHKHDQIISAPFIRCCSNRHWIELPNTLAHTKYRNTLTVLLVLNRRPNTFSSAVWCTIRISTLWNSKQLLDYLEPFPEKHPLPAGTFPVATRVSRVISYLFASYPNRSILILTPPPPPQSPCCAAIDFTKFWRCAREGQQRASTARTNMVAFRQGPLEHQLVCITVYWRRSGDQHRLLSLFWPNSSDTRHGYGHMLNTGSWVGEWNWW